MCSNCKYWQHVKDRYHSVGGGVHIKSRLGECTNPIVKDLTFLCDTAATISILTHSILFDESFACVYEESNTDNPIQ